MILWSQESESFFMMHRLSSTGTTLTLQRVKDPGACILEYRYPMSFRRQSRTKFKTKNCFVWTGHVEIHRPPQKTILGNL
jgi:hypothetical protein